jgi:hypothetical protein
MRTLLAGALCVVALGIDGLKSGMTMGTGVIQAKAG